MIYHISVMRGCKLNVFIHKIVVKVVKTGLNYIFYAFDAV